MAKGKGRSHAHGEFTSGGGISGEQRAELVRAARNARARIREFAKTDESEYYYLPDTSNYTIKALDARLNSGESFQSVLNEVSGITRASLQASPITVGLNGESFSMSEMERLREAVNEANQNIREARERYSGFEAIMPSEFNFKDIASNLLDSQGLLNRIGDLSLFTADNLIPTAINNFGEAGTIAEYQYYRNVLERENLRRQEQREENDPRTHEGFFRIQSDYDQQPIDINAIATFDELKRKAETWDDPKRVERANLFLTNYEQQLSQFEVALINNGLYNSFIEERIQEIRDIISQLYYKEKAITYASERQPDINIALLYDTSGDVDFSAIYDSWLFISEMFLE